MEPSNSIPIIDKNPIIWLEKGIINQIGSLQWAAKLCDLMQFHWEQEWKATLSDLKARASLKWLKVAKVSN